MPSSGIWNRMDLVRTDVSEECVLDPANVFLSVLILSNLKIEGQKFTGYC